MATSTLSPSTYADLVDLGRRLYEQALVRREQELITDPRGQPIGWLLDTRIPMLDGRMFREVGRVLSERLRAKGIHQVCGYGFGAYSMVCSVLASPGTPAFHGGFVRDNRKPHGRRRLVEGPMDRARPVVLLDDILNSGRSAAHAIALMRNDGFEVVGVMTLFNFTWSGGRARIEADGVWVDSLLDLNLRDNNRSSSDSL
jgi:orotate phosphoribosyltransferase